MLYTHFDKELESFVLLLELLEEADGFIVAAAELSIDPLHVFSILLRKLHTHTFCSSTTTSWIVR